MTKADEFIAGIEKKYLSFVLKRKKLHGEFALVRLKIKQKKSGF